MRTYFDYAASTPVSPRVLAAMRPYFSQKFGNPGSLHSFGQEALAAVDRSREVIAAALGAQFREVVFTGSATEANNLALRGAVNAWRQGRTISSAPRIVISSIEHESVLETARDLEKDGIEVVVLPVDRKGSVKMDALTAALNERTALVSIMCANNETGAVQSVTKIASVIREVRLRSNSGRYPLFHTDAVQAFQFLECNVDALGVDLLTLSAHKIYGPKGVGVLYVRGDEPKKMLAPSMTGGGQEFGVRSGTENVALIAGFVAAIEEVRKDKDKHSRRIAGLKEQLLGGIKNIYPRAQLNGPVTALPHIANLWFPGVKAEDLLIRLDLAGIAIAAGSACTARSSQPSHVLRAMGLPEKRLRESVRISFGRPSTTKEVARLLKVLGSLNLS